VCVCVCEREREERKGKKTRVEYRVLNEQQVVMFDNWSKTLANPNE